MGAKAPQPAPPGPKPLPLTDAPLPRPKALPRPKDVEVKFKRGQKVRHRASGEIGIIHGTTGCYSGSYNVEYGFGKYADDTPGLMLEPVHEPDESSIASRPANQAKSQSIAPDYNNIQTPPNTTNHEIEADVFGKTEQFEVLGLVADGLLCRGKDKLSTGIVREAQAKDRDEFRRILTEIRG